MSKFLLHVLYVGYILDVFLHHETTQQNMETWLLTKY